MENEKMMENDNHERGRQNLSNRRNVLKFAGTAGAISLLPTGSAVARSTDGGPDPTFDPNRKKETAKFVDDCFRARNDAVVSAQSDEEVDSIVEEEREQTLSQLDTEQIRAIENTLNSGRMVMSRKVVSTGKNGIAPRKNGIAPRKNGNGVQKAETDEVSTASGHDGYEVATFSETVEAEYRVPVLGNTYDACSYTHEIQWEHNADEWDVRNIDQTCYGSGKNYRLVRWSYEGDTDQDVEKRQGGNYFTSDSTGLFDRCIISSFSWSCVKTDRIYTRVAGNMNGTGRLVDVNIHA